MNTVIRFSILVSISLLLFSCGSATKESGDGGLNSVTTEVAPSGYSGLKVPVSLTTLKPTAFSHYFVATGELESVDEAFISAEVAGLIVDIYVKDGDKVKRDQVLAKLNTDVIESNILEVQSQLELAETIFAKQTTLWEQNIGSERQYLEAKNSFEGLQNRLATLKVQYDLHLIKSPINGVVEEVFMQKGEIASPGMRFMYVVNIEQLLVKAQVSEAYLAVIKKGDKVLVSFPSLPGVSLQREISRTGNVINKQNRTFTVEIELDNPDWKLKPNMIANIEINDYFKADALVVPSILIRKDLNGSYLYVAVDKNGEKVAQKQYVETGRSFKDETEILKGLNLNSVVITNGYNNVSDGAVLNVIAN
ncbi:MAG: efflux RND transporter periplasmic adaptor subunit [Bacteroidales bacterium]|nr:efflux RND transporter periplasmic adaptor subunit [Bacteroidales bacterium]